MQKKVVVMGGGTGTFPVVAALRMLVRREVDLSTIIAVSDSGGSTGRIRDEFGFPPVGDLRQALAALAESEGEQWIRKILLYRFEKGTGLKGHNLGNLILTALQDMTGSTTEALEIAEKVFRLEGQVIPVTQDNVNLQVEYEDGSVIVGEHMLDQDIKVPKKIRQIKLVPPTRMNPVAATAIENAQMIVIGPGDYYASVMSTLTAEGTKKAFFKSKGKIVYVVNLMTRLTQTHGMSAYDHVAGIEKAIGKRVHKIVFNNEAIPQTILDVYAHENEFPVIDDLGKDSRVIRTPLLSAEVFKKSQNDTTHRSLLRHDKQKLSRVLDKLLSPQFLPDFVTRR
jgi:uncharacterized cofD-like protein